MPRSNTIIRIRKSQASGNVPSILANGEIAINQVDGKLFYSRPSGQISYITNQQSFATINANSSLVLASSGTDTLSIIPGNNISISACTSSKSITVELNSSISVSNIIVPTLYTTSGGIVFPDGSIQVTSAEGSAYDAVARELASAAIANTIYLQGVDNTQNTNIQIATDLAQSAFDKANTPSTNSFSTISVNGISNTIVASSPVSELKFAPSGGVYMGVDSTNNTIGISMMGGVQGMVVDWGYVYEPVVVQINFGSL